MRRRGRRKKGRVDNGVGEKVSKWRDWGWGWGFGGWGDREEWKGKSVLDPPRNVRL